MGVSDWLKHSFIFILLFFYLLVFLSQIPTVLLTFEKVGHLKRTN